MLFLEFAKTLDTEGFIFRQSLSFPHSHYDDPLGTGKQTDVDPALHAYWSTLLLVAVFFEFAEIFHENT